MGKRTKKTKATYVLKLFVSGASPNSVRAIHNIRAICDSHIEENYTLEIVDVRQNPLMTGKEQIVALPLLIKKQPLPERKLIGDMSNTLKVLTGLGLEK